MHMHAVVYIVTISKMLLILFHTNYIFLLKTASKNVVLGLIITVVTFIFENPSTHKQSNYFTGQNIIFTILFSIDSTATSEKKQSEAAFYFYNY